MSNTETSDETDTTVERKPEKVTETAKTSFEPTSESNEPETAQTESKKPVEADKTDIPAAPKAETETPKPEAPKSPVSEETKEPEKPVQPEKEPPAEQPTEEVKPKTAYLYRVFKDGVSETQMDNFKDKLYHGRATRADITRLTRRLGDEIAAVYGFDIPKQRTPNERSER